MTAPVEHLFRGGERPMTPGELALRMMALEATWLDREPTPPGVDLLRRERLALDAALASGEPHRIREAHDSAERVAYSLAAFWGVPFVPPDDSAHVSLARAGDSE